MEKHINALPGNKRDKQYIAFENLPHSRSKMKSLTGMALTATNFLTWKISLLFAG
jgi:hypothetical protein